jgi:hypothetical protein
MQCWVNGPATDGIDAKINPPAADYYSIFGAGPKDNIIFILSVCCGDFEMLPIHHLFDRGGQIHKIYLHFFFNIFFIILGVV